MWFASRNIWPVIDPTPFIWIVGVGQACPCASSVFPWLRQDLQSLSSCGRIMSFLHSRPPCIVVASHSSTATNWPGSWWACANSPAMCATRSAALLPWPFCHTRVTKRGSTNIHAANCTIYNIARCNDTNCEALDSRRHEKYTLFYTLEDIIVPWNDRFMSS